MLENKQNNVIFIKKSDKPSRFLVNLNKLQEEKEKKPEKLGWLKKWQEKHHQKAKRLAVYPLFRLLFQSIINLLKLGYKICYSTGWLTVFTIKIFYVLAVKIFKPFFSLLLLLKSRPKAYLIKKSEYKINEEAEPSSGRSKQEVHGSNKKLISFRTVFKLFGLGLFLWFIKKRKKEKLEPMPISAGNFFNKFSYKKALTFSLILIALVLPVKAFFIFKNLDSMRGNVLEMTEAAYGDMKTAGESAMDKNFENASQSLNRASGNFLRAKDEIADVNSFLAVLGKVLPNKNIKLAANADLLLEAGKLSADIGQNLINSLANLPDGGQYDVKSFIGSLYINIGQAAKNAENLKNTVAKIDAGSLPDEYRLTFLKLQEKSGELSNILNELADLISKARIFFGFDYDKRYLLIFQNNTEMRASGGFVGSFALLDFSQGKIKKLEVPGGGSYDTEGGLYERIIAPSPLAIVNPLWHFWDANWWPDWPSSAQKLAWFYEKSGGPTVDGVISFTPTVVEGLLGAIGPVDMQEQYGIIFTAENFWQETQIIAEQKPLATTAATGSETVKHEPKKIVGDLFSKIIEEMPKRINKETGLKIIETIEAGLTEKQIMFYFNDPAMEDKVKELSWDGSVKDTNWDYLMVVNTNIAGGKSDRKIVETISHKAEIEPDGSITDKVTIKRTHTGNKADKLTGVRNVNWLRIYVPQGSELIEAQGFYKPDEKYFEKPDPAWQADPDLKTEENAAIDASSGTKIYSENDKTVFANWCMVNPGETITLYLKYKLPFKISFDSVPDQWREKFVNVFNPSQKELMPYALLAQKQPGSIGSEIESSLLLADNFKIVWTYPNNLDVTSGSWTIKDNLTVDKFWAVLIEKL